MRALLLLSLLGLTMQITACGKDKDDKSYAYDFESNGCKTGRHSFSTLAAMCNALQDEELNNGCALGMRVDYFEESCGNRQFDFGNHGFIGN